VCLREAGGLTDQLARWQAYLETTAHLPEEERELVGLYFYQGWAVSRIAELLDVDAATVRKRLQTVGLTLSELLNHRIPNF
jgi:DNA-directed RNA polymerase specialized sigma24 family protein